MENTNKVTPSPKEVKEKVQARLELDKGKSLEEIYHDDSSDRLYNYYLKMEVEGTWNR